MLKINVNSNKKSSLELTRAGLELELKGDCMIAAEVKRAITGFA